MQKMMTGLLLGSAMLISACAEREPITEEELQRTTETAEEAAQTPEPEALAEEAGIEEDADAADSEGPALQAMAFNEAESVVEPGLGCAFISADDLGLFFVDDTAKAAVKLNDTIVALTAEGEADFDTVQQGGTYASEALSITIERAEGEGEAVGQETTQWDATLNVTQDEGGSRSYEGGKYSCGS